MTDKAHITILVPTYNQEDSIGKTLDSILEQETKYNYKILIAEDCSTDKTVQICQKYVDKYPDKIELIAQTENTNAEHLRAVLFGITSKYLTILDGDDYWSSPNKLQKAVSFLDKNPNYITFAHDTLYNDKVKKAKQSLVHDIHKATIKNPMTFDNMLYLHTSARTYRNNINLGKAFDGGRPLGDLNLLYLYLNRGPLYYHDEIMSVYNITGKGIWSKLPRQEQVLAEELANYNCNKLLDFQQDEFFTNRAARPGRLRKLKRLLGMRLGWSMYVRIAKAGAKDDAK